MKIALNQTEITLPDGATVKEALAVAGYDTDARGIAVAVNNELVKRVDWDSCQLSQGDDLIVIKAAYGG